MQCNTWFLPVSLFLCLSISRFPKHGAFFCGAFRAARVTGGGDEGASRARPDHRQRFVYIATTAILSTRRTDFCFDALVLGSVLIPASGHISSCKVCWKNRLCLSPKLRPGSHAGSWRHSLRCVRKTSAHTACTSLRWVTTRRHVEKRWFVSSHGIFFQLWWAVKRAWGPSPSVGTTLRGAVHGRPTGDKRRTRQQPTTHAINMLYLLKWMPIHCQTKWGRWEAQFALGVPRPSAAAGADKIMCVHVWGSRTRPVPNMLVCWWQSWTHSGINHLQPSAADFLKNRSDNNSNC